MTGTDPALFDAVDAAAIRLHIGSRGIGPA
jgi:hypothetical protein